MVVAPPDLEAQLGTLLGETTTEIDVPRKNRVFCNRNLRMDSIEMIGFDMDYTLALYHQEKLEQLSIELTLRKLIEKHGYPEAIRGLHYDPRWAIRGVMVDRKLGNVFKLDRHSHVGRCFHGFQELDHDRESIVAHDPPRLPGSASALEELQALPDALRTVLVVDDNPIFRTFLHDVLGRRGFTVYEAGDGEEALRTALEQRPWLILTDVSMPGVDGIEFCRRVRRHSLIRHTPLIFLSGWDDYKDRYRGLEAGADEYLSKETPVRELMIRIQLVLKRYSDIGGRGFKGPGMEGRLEIIGMPGLLQMCGLGRLTGVLSVGSGGRPAVVRFREGEVVSAAAGGPTAADAIYELLSWTEGNFSFAPGEVEGDPLQPALTELLLEGCRRLDERQRD